MLAADWYSHMGITSMVPKELNIKLPLDAAIPPQAVSKGLFICPRSRRKQLNIHDNTDQTEFSHTAAQPP